MKFEFDSQSIQNHVIVMKLLEVNTVSSRRYTRPRGIPANFTLTDEGFTLDYCSELSTNSLSVDCLFLQK